MNDTPDQFRQAIAAAGLAAPDVIMDDGLIHRFSTNGKPRDTSGWYILHIDGVPAGSFGDWREGFTQTWCAKSDTAMTDAEREAHRQRIKAMQAAREADLSQRQHDAAIEAERRFSTAKTCTTHDYLSRKGIKPHGVKLEGSYLLVPMRSDGAIKSLQTITPDGTKMFMPGGRVKGCYFSIGKPAGQIVIAEGFATGATIHEATGGAVAVAFNAGNLGAVAIAMHRKFPKLALIVAADDDHMTAGNPGLTKAKDAALAVGGFVVVPQFPAGRPATATDFNDLAALAGLDAVRACFSEIAGFVC